MSKPPAKPPAPAKPAKPKLGHRRHDVTVRLNDDEFARLMGAVARAEIPVTRKGMLGTSEFIRQWCTTLPPNPNGVPPRTTRPRTTAYHPG